MAKKPKRDAEREERITMEIVVDCYDRHEVALGWYCYLENTLQFPFTASCIAKRAVSPLRVKDEVEVIGMALPRAEWGLANYRVDISKSQNLTPLYYSLAAAGDLGSGAGRGPFPLRPAVR